MWHQLFFTATKKSSNRLNPVPVNGFDVAPVGATFVAVTATKGATLIFYCHISLLYHVVGATTATFFLYIKS